MNMARPARTKTFPVMVMPLAASSRYTACVPADPATEVCNNRDDDCDGSVEPEEYDLDGDDWLDLVLATRVTPQFAPEHLTVLRHFPASQAALARICPDDPGVADRFEVFLGEVELANGYVELTDAAEQAARIRRDNAQRDGRGLIARPADEFLLAALASGLPPCSGVAMGLERLHMIHDNTDDISEVLTFRFTGDA